MKILLSLKLFLIFCISAGTLNSQPLQLVPMPQQAEALGNNFTPDDRTVIGIFSGSDEDRFAADGLNEEAALYGHSFDIKKDADIRNSIVLTRPGLNAKADRALENAGLKMNGKMAEEGYLLLADKDHVIVSAQTAAGLFYGVQTLRQLIRENSEGKLYIQGAAVCDWPAMRYRWQQDDWSRGPIPNLEYAKQQIKTLAEYKMNGYSIYAENIYQSDLNPAINPYGGTITPEQIRELIEYAKPYHVEIIPQQQTFGHLHYVLRQERYAHLGEKHASQILSPEEPDSYEFIKDYLGEIIPMFSSDFIHIGCDETFELGRGKSKDRVSRTSHADVYMDHLNKVAEIAAPYHKRLLFWGEIAVEHPEKLGRLPQSCIAVAWDYLPRDNYDTFLKAYAEHNIPTFVTPSAFYGGRVVPDYTSHMKNIRNFVRDGQKYGSLGMMNSSWDDLGEDLFDMGWYSVVFSAACAWQSGESDIETYDRAFDWAFYRNAENHAYADGIKKLASIHDQSGAVNFEMAFSCPFTKIGAQQQNHLIRQGIARKMRLLAEDAYTLFYQNRNNAPLHGQTIDALMFGARRMDFVFHKALLAQELSDLYDAFVRDDDKGYAVNTALYDMIMPYASRIGSLRDMTKELKNYHKTLWERENRPFHWDIINARYDRLLMQWDEQNERIQLSVSQLGQTGTPMPREETGFLFDRAGQ